MFLAGWNETLRSHSAVVSLCSPSAPSRAISQDGAGGKTAQAARRRKTEQTQQTAQTEHRQNQLRFSPAME